MNASHLAHVAYALLMQLVIGAATTNWWAGAAFAVAWFVSREHAQREYKLFTFGETNRLKPWDGFRGWSIDAIGDAGWPALAVCLVAYFI